MSRNIGLEIEATAITNALHIKLSYPGLLNLTYNFKLVLSVSEEDIISKTEKKVYERVFHTVQKQIVVEGLEFSKMYKIVGKVSVGREEEVVKNIYAFTRAEDSH